MYNYFSARKLWQKDRRITQGPRRDNILNPAEQCPRAVMDSLPGGLSGLQLLGCATDNVLGGGGGVCLGGDRRRSLLTLLRGRPDGRSADVIEGILCVARCVARV